MQSDLIELLSVFVGTVLVGYMVFKAWTDENKIWNSGICEKNGEPWEQFDTSSQGCRGYRAGDEYCWISCPFIDR